MKVAVTATDSAVLIRPWIPQLERHLFFVREKDEMQELLTASGKVVKKRVVTRKTEKLYRVDGGTGFLYPGSLDLVWGLLTRFKIGIDFVDLRSSLPVPDWSRLSVELREGQPEVLRAMTEYPHALIKAATGLGKTETIVQYRRVCPDVKLAVVTFSGNVRNSIYDRLKTGAPEHDTCMLASGLKFFDTDTYVLLDKSLHRLPYENVDTLIIDEVHGMAAESAFSRFLEFADKRIYGLSATPLGRSDNADLATLSLCGPLRANLSYEFSVQTGSNVPIYVYVYDAKGPGWLTDKPDFIRERFGIYRNEPRNQKIAQLCRGLPNTDQATVVCKTAEHVLRLRQLLPDWCCVFGAPSAGREEELKEQGLLSDGWKELPNIRTDTNAARQEFEKGTLRKSIITPIWREGVDARELRWIVRADGTSTMIRNIQIGGRSARRIAGEKEWAVIIDFMDKFSGFEGRSWNRLKAYRKEGWSVRRVD